MKLYLKIILFILISLHLSAQDKMKAVQVIENFSVGEFEVTLFKDLESQKVLRTNLHSNSLFSIGEKLILQFDKELGRWKVEKKGLTEQVYVLVDSQVNYSPEAEQSGENSALPKVSSPFPFCNDNEPIGGGKGYSQMITGSNVDIFINSFTSAGGFKTTIETASEGSTIFINDTLVIDLSNLFNSTGSSSIIVPKGVTIASSRGDNSSLGAEILTTDFDYYNVNPYVQGAPLFIVNDGVRFTGLRFTGPFDLEGVDFSNADIRYKSCIKISGNDSLEVDNCTFSGWPYSAVIVGGSSPNGSFLNNKIHHCYFYNNRQRGLGYGVLVDWGYAHIYSNVFKSNRHDIAGSGKTGSGYEASCNSILEGGTSHNFDMHAEGTNNGSANAGRFIYVHHNDFQDLGCCRYLMNNEYNFRISGRPDVQCRVENNRFAHSNPKAAIFQTNGLGGYGNLLVWNNIYGSTEYLGWYVKNNWLASNASNFMNLPSNNDELMTTPLNSNALYDYHFEFGDFDGDGKTDIFKLEEDAIYTIPLDAGVHGLNSDWNLIMSTGFPLNSMRFGFYDNDNKTDIIRQGGNNLYFNSGITSGLNLQWTLQANLSEFQDADLDGNGVTDLFVSDAIVWKAHYNLSSSLPIITTSTTPVSNLKVGRFDANATSDILIVNGFSFKYSAGGNTNSILLQLSSFTSSELMVADIDGDNISDIIHKTLKKVSLGGNTNFILCNTSVFPISSFTYGNF